MSFKITVPIENCYINKSVDNNGNEVEKRYITGLASGTELDRDTEMMAESALHAMREAIEFGIITEKGEVSQVPLYNEHRKETLEQLGWLTRAWLEKSERPDGTMISELWVEAELDDDNPRSQQLFKKLTTKGPKNRPVQLGLSISGKVTKAFKKFDPQIKKAVTVFEHIALGEVSVVTRPAYAGSYLDILEKSYKEETGHELPFYGENNMNGNEAEAQNIETTSDTTTEKNTVTDTQDDLNVTEKATSNDSQEVLTLDAVEKAFEPQFKDLGEQIRSISVLLGKLQEVLAPTPAEDADKSADTTDPDVSKAETTIDEEGVNVLKQAISEALAGAVNPLVEKIDAIEKSVADLQKPNDQSFSVLGETEKTIDKNAVYEARKSAAAANGQGFDPIQAALDIALNKQR